MTRRRTHPPPTPLSCATTPCPAAACAQDSTSRSSCEPDPASSPELHLLPRLPSANRTPPSGFSGTAVSSGPTSSPEAVHRCSASFRPCNGLPCTALAEAGILEEYFQPGRALSTVQEDNNDSQYDGFQPHGVRMIELVASSSPWLPSSTFRCLGPFLWSCKFSTSEYHVRRFSSVRKH
ncbi:uncharacterized protein LOC119296399 isoform X4 [Triticum dicoccoides]|uniref:uncharacterized protein LOC119296399 isoform X4 n=1 Tax=Triticum dicoccoides TaxID=85692 RepID=UPI00188E20F6|nr:uncharacterized protein LOC119296399 isoform X4 [Triticum dicoccoides]